MKGTMASARLFAVALVVSMVGPSVATLADGAPAHAECTSEICRCTHARPATPKPAAAGCHEGAPRREPDCTMTARCSHETAFAMPEAPKPALTLAPLTVDADLRPLTTVVLPAGSAHAGFSRIDSPPPRPA
jgi:hypothetical protein